MTFVIQVSETNRENLEPRIEPLGTAAGSTAVIFVPDDHGTIQDAIDSARDGDMVIRG